MGATIESVVFGWVRTQRPSRVLCASCNRLFDAESPATGERVRCMHCREIVEIGVPVVRKSRRHSSRTSLAPWVDEPRSAGAEAMGRVAICAAFVAGALYVLASVSGVEPSSTANFVVPEDDYVTDQGSRHW